MIIFFHFFGGYTYMWGLRVSDFIIYFVTLNLFRMNKHLRYAETDKMSELICENYKLLLVMSRFGLSLGFGARR